MDFPSGPLSRSYTVSHVLYKEQIKHLKARGLWPFPDTEAAAAAVYDPFAGIDDERSDEEEVEEEEEGGDAPG